MLFPDGLDQLPRLSGQNEQAATLNALAIGYQLEGQSNRAVSMYSWNITILSEMKADLGLRVVYCNLSNILRMNGGLYQSEEAARRALEITHKLDNRFQEAISLQWLGMALAAHGKADKSGVALQRSLNIFIEQNESQSEGFVNSWLAQRAIWFEEYANGLQFAGRAWKLAHVHRHEWDFMLAARTAGEGALGLNDLVTADERLHHALTRARAVNRVEEELPALTALAELRRRQGDEKAAREFLDDVWEFAERGPCPLLHADALNVLAQIERDAGNKEAAVEAATKAYQLSWCDGPPYAYNWGLIKAQKHLEELGAPLPKMEPFDESKFEPMPEVEVDPEDEFHVGSS
jgi:tetratricopeptide (TPR) repeat protein